MGLAVLELAPPRSMNASPQRGGRGAGIARHKAKRALQAEFVRMLQAANVPRPIPGDRVHATALLLFPTARRRDEGNYRTALEKALGDALAPAPTREERELGLEPLFRWLSDDTPEHFTFGAVTFGHRHGRPAVARVELVWGEHLADALERDAQAARAHLSAGA